MVSPPFFGSSVVCGPPRHKGPIDAFLDHGEHSTEPSTEIVHATDPTEIIVPKINKRSAKRCPTQQAQLHDTYYQAYGYEYKCNDGYDIDNGIDTIYANAAQSHQVMVPTDKYRQLSCIWAAEWDVS